MKELVDFTATKKYLICVDSDGCAMDTMDIKHKKCFGPCMIEEWDLLAWAEPIQNRWNDINLYTELRGINRFKGLAIALKEINVEYKEIEGLDYFVSWTEETKELSNQSLMEQIKKEQEAGNNISCLQKALQWSNNLNQRIKELTSDEKLPFENVLEGLRKAHEYADIAIVSSANYDAVYEEWSENGLLDHVDLLLSQNVGSKAYCIEKLIEKGYAKENVMMVGDAPGDEKAADLNHVYYYPILVRHEAESWETFINETLDKFVNNDFSEYAKQLKVKFHENLGK